MKRVVKYIAIVIAVGFLLLQIVRPEMSNPPVVEADRIENFVAIPPDVAAVFKRSCSDCHTNETRYPWYSQVSPVSWWLQNHVEHGRSHLNFSEWAKYTPQQKSKRLEEICEVVESKEMPLPSYLWGHSDAVLNDEDGKRLCEWARGAQTKE